LLVKSLRPSLALQTMMEWGIIRQYYPEFHALRNTPQEFDWHPEGDVWVHTLMVVDEAAKIAAREHFDDYQKMELMFAALCHDLGKATTTEYNEVKGKKRFTAYGHDKAGIEPTQNFLKKFPLPSGMKDRIIKLIEHHLAPSMLFHEKQKNPDMNHEGALRRLAQKVDPATLEMLTFVAEADNMGRGPFPDPEEPKQFLLQFGYEAGPWIRAEANKLDVLHEKPKPVITGRELIDLSILQKKDGILFREIIDAANKLRDELGWQGSKILSELTAIKESGQTPDTFADHLEGLLPQKNPLK